ncbi:MAG: hypothetical protein E7335_00025 [Clostridiales bacterium]|nr:hypothetical protein [Clostridiales bacterium]
MQPQHPLPQRRSRPQPQSRCSPRQRLPFHPVRLPIPRRRPLRSRRLCPRPARPRRRPCSLSAA